MSKQTPAYSSEKLRTAEQVFMEMYPAGFESEELQAIVKKFRIGASNDFAREALAKKRFLQQGQVLDDIVKIVTRSSMVSLFEKPKFRDYVKGLSRDDREFLAEGYRKLIHGPQQQGFEAVADVLREGKLAKWSLMTICLLHYRPQKEVFVKPTTTKAVLKVLEVEDLVYKPQPTWAFYKSYRALIDEMKSKVHPTLSPNNAAFTGFLMRTTS